jgi:hypothetical protein
VDSFRLDVWENWFSLILNAFQSHRRNTVRPRPALRSADYARGDKPRRFMHRSLCPTANNPRQKPAMLVID